MFNIDAIQYLDADASWRERFCNEFGEKAARHLHFSDGFTISAVYHDKIVGFISTHWSQLPPPFSGTTEGYIDILEVSPPFRRHGIASRLIDLSIQRLAERRAYQVRAWSSEDKTEALPMWRKLGFGLCPATEYHRGQEIHGFFVTKVLM